MSLGIITGNLIDSTSQKAAQGVSISLTNLVNNKKLNSISSKTGEFSFENLGNGYYSLEFSSSELSTLKIDSIHIRADRYDFNLPDIKLYPKSSELQTVVVYAEKPLIESKEGNITFNASESALSAGSNASELLQNVPLVSKDPDGKITVRGKEPKILIDDKPVELNLQQLQDMLESMPGSSIEKIEVMTNPPPQYANEQGGVINIVTKKGKVGKGGRLSISSGTRGEGSVNGNYFYRKNKIAINIIGGTGLSRYSSFGGSERKNSYTDSTNYFNTESNSRNKSTRPNFRINTDYTFSKFSSLNLTGTFNVNSFNNNNKTQYTNINRFDEIYKLSERNIHNEGDNYNTSFSINYTKKTNLPGEQLRIISGINFSANNSDRTFYQQFFNPDHTFNGTDSTQVQETQNKSNGFYIRVNYDKPIIEKKIYLSLGTAFTRNNSNVVVDAEYLKKPDNTYQPLDLLSNYFKYHQDINNVRGSVKQILGNRFSISAGLAAERTNINFDLLKQGNEATNNYWNFLPFANFNKAWGDNLNLTLAYRKTIRRPGINELNPTIDFSDPYNIRFGNFRLNPSLAHNFDLVIGRTKPKYFLNFAVGYNKVEDIFSQIRTLLSDGKTQITWENISHRQEYEVSTWNGFTLDKKVRVSYSASYTYNKYSDYDKSFRKYRDGGSFTTTLNGNYSLKDVWNFNGNFTTNRFANPQGSVSWNLSMNVGIQKKFFNKRFITTINFIDPFRNQITNRYTYGSNFEVHSNNTAQTKNYRLTLAYNFTKPAKKPISKKS